MRIPVEAAGFQVNFCKSPLCPNFGRPASATRPYRAKGTPPVPGDYTIVGAGKANPCIKCAFCGEIAPLRSNQAIAEEAFRLAGGLFAEPDEPSCQNPACGLHHVPLSKAAGQYVSFGKTAAGTPRYRCKACGKTFSGNAKPIARQRRSEKNRDVFLLIMNKAPISRMQETTGLHPKALYDKIAFIHRQCCAFAAAREKRLGDPGFQLPKMYLAVDRQHYVVNWTQRTDRRTIQLNAIASADLASGYVFGFHLNFDPNLDGRAISDDAKAVGDVIQDAPFRKYARVWLPEDYAEAQADAAKRDAASKYVATKGGRFKDDLLNDIELAYVDAMVRDDVEESDHKDGAVKLPAKGMQVHEQYTMYAHFMLLARLLRNAPKVRMFMDQDSGFRAAFMAAFAERIRNRTADGFFVKVGKEAGAYQKQNVVAKAKVRVAQVAEDYGWTLDKALLELMKAEIDGAVPLGKWKDKWAMHPMPIAAEPFKRICWLTDMGDLDADHAARLHLKATLHPIDRFFMQTRRRLSMAERPVVSVRKQRTMWHGYGAYNPGTLAKFLETYRTYYNYCLVGKDKKTPAMRLGLAQAAIDPQDILYFG